MAQRLLLILNPIAGTRRAARSLSDVIGLFNQNGYECLTFVTGARGDGARIAAAHAGDAALVVCAGGDGTLNEVVSGVLQAGASTPIGYIPAGSTNDFAASLHLSRDVMTAARDILQGVPRPFDVGTFNGRCFCYVASFGAFTAASYTTPQPTKNLLGHLAYILEGMKDLPNIKPVTLSAEADGDHFQGDFIFGALTNSTSIAGLVSIPKERVNLHDGKLEFTLVRAPQTAADLSKIVKSLQTQNFDPDVIHFQPVRRVRLSVPQGLTWTLDGEYEPGGQTIEIKSMRDAIRLIIRENANG